MTEHLHILSGSDAVGIVSYDRVSDSLEWTYDSSWRDASGAYPASVSLPLSQACHGDRVARTFLNGLLPDNPNVLDAWGKRFHVSPRNPFDLVKYVGEDCAGALQFVRPDRLELILSGQLDKLVRLSAGELAARFRDLKLQSKAIPVHIEGRFSLAGAQTKDALHRKGDRWFLPEGRFPSTHILKTPLESFERHTLNEHFCLALASRTGLPAPHSEILFIDGEAVICIERYDRRADSDGHVARIHQEDCCQALSIPPSTKYQNEGGPSPENIVSLLREQSDNAAKDIESFLRALALNQAIAGTDAHAKNYSLLHAPGGFTRLAPIYDIASFLPYQRDLRKTRMAMKIGDTYRLHEIGEKQWRKLAAKADLDPDHVASTARAFFERILAAVPETLNQTGRIHDQGFLDNLASRIEKHTRLCLSPD